jgi:hypothetical protein
MVFRRRRRFGLVTANSSHFFLHLSQLQSFPSLLLIEPLHLQFEPASLLADSLVLQLLFLNQLNFVERLLQTARSQPRLYNIWCADLVHGSMSSSETKDARM